MDISADVEICSVADLLQVLKDLVDPNRPTWYRGHANKDWGLVPSLSRRPENIKKEISLIKRFSQNASALLPSRIPDSDWDWIFLMQHHSVPTRLLDWSESPLVAAFFALQGDQGTDGALWVLDPVRLNRAGNHRQGQVEFELPAFGRAENEENVLSNYTPEQVAHNKATVMSPIAVIAPRHFSRMVAQASVFTLHHRPPTPIESILDENGEQNSVACKLVIPMSAKKDLARELKTLGYSVLSMFPDLDRVAEVTREVLDA